MANWFSSRFSDGGGDGKGICRPADGDPEAIEEISGKLWVGADARRNGLLLNLRAVIKVYEGTSTSAIEQETNSEMYAENHFVLDNNKHFPRKFIMRSLDKIVGTEREDVST